MSLKSSYSFLLLLIRLLAIQWLIMFKSVTSEFRLTIIHNNDFHANYVPSSFSPPNDDHHGGCFNGCGWLKRWLFNNIHPFQVCCPSERNVLGINFPKRIFMMEK